MKLADIDKLIAQCDETALRFDEAPDREAEIALTILAAVKAILLEAPAVEAEMTESGCSLTDDCAACSFSKMCKYVEDDGK